MKRIAFLGLGNMGAPIAKNLIGAKLEVTVWNRTTSRTTPFAALGARVARTPKEAVREVDAVLYCLGSDEANDRVVFGADGLLQGVSPGQIAVNMSTAHPSLSHRESAAFAEKGCEYLDAPLFGSVAEATSGGLWIIVGGNKETFARMQPVFAPLAESVHHMGPVGMGAATSLIGSLVVALQLQAASEALVLATKIGLDPAQVLHVIGLPDFRSPIFSGMCGGVPRRDFTTAFALKHLQKDVELVASLADANEVPVPASAAVRELIKSAVAHGWGDENASALIKALELQANVVVRAKNTT